MATPGIAIADCGDRGHIDDLGDVGSAVANVNANPFFCHGSLLFPYAAGCGLPARQEERARSAWAACCSCAK